MFQKPNKKSFTDGAVQAISLGLGMKVGDGIATLMPDSVSSYKYWILAALGLGIAASVSTKTTSGSAVQAMALGVSANGIYNGLTEVISPSIDKQPTNTTSGRFVNALVGHKEVTKAQVAEVAEALGNSFQWEPTAEIGAGDLWNRPQQIEEVREINIGLV